VIEETVEHHLSHDRGRAFLDDIALRAEARREKQARVARLELQPFQTCSRVSFASPSGFTGVVAVE
jgi:hypothetical protein